MIPKTVLEACDNPDGLLALLRELGWPIFGNIEEAFFDEPDIAGRRPVRVRSLVPSGQDDPFLVLLAEFNEPVRREDLRELLQSLRRTQRLNAVFGETTGYEDTVFVAVDPDYRRIRFARFEEHRGQSAKLRVFGWDLEHLDKTRTVRHHNLPLLRLRRLPNGRPDWTGAEQHWREAFRVEALSSRFYQEYRAIFDRYLDRLILDPGQPDGLPSQRFAEGDEKKPIATAFLQRQMNRLLFVAFVQQKEWLDFNGRRRDYLFAVYEDWLANPGEGETFYHRLRKLFFGAFRVRDRAERALLADSIGVVPYLNGGLFEPSDFESEDGAEGLLLPPNEFFSDLLGRGIGNADDGLLRAYDFNVSENLDESDQDVAVDPEMLGHIFEQLVTDRQEGGKFYTPRPVVRFMCREALKGYLGGYSALIDAPVKEDRLAATNDLSGGDLARIIERLSKVTVIDPACGSGAYLLGMLHELFELNEVVQRRRGEYTEAERYRTKQEIIQRNLFGVDLDETAANIAMLRLWLALAVESRQRPLENPDADVSLPNLRFKVQVGDSLVARSPRGMTLAREGFVKIADRAKSLHEEWFDPEGRRRRSKEQIEGDLAALDLDLNAVIGDPVPGVVDFRRAFPYVFAPEEPTANLAGEFNFGQGLAEAPEPGGFDIVLANPPYGEGGVTEALRTEYFGPRSNQSKDIYASFMVRALHLLRPGGWMVYIVSNTWRTLSTHRPLRKKLLERTSISHVLDVPEWTFDATVRTCILTLQNQPATADHTMIAGDLQALPKDNWGLLERNLRAVASHGPDLQTDTFARYTYPQTLLSQDMNAASFIALPSFARFFTGNERMLGTGTRPLATVAQGLATADDNYYLRSLPGTRGGLGDIDPALVFTQQEVAALSPEERRDGVDPAEHGGRYFAPFDKGGASDASGGWLPCFHVPTEYYIDWSHASVTRLKTATKAVCKLRRGEAHKIKPGDDRKIASRFQNSALYFERGITFSVAGRYAPTFRYGSASVFGHKGSTIFPPADQVDTLLSVLNSSLIRFLTKVFVNNAWGAEVDDVKRLPIRSERADEFATLARLIAEKQNVDARYPYWLDELPKIDALVAEVYGLSAAEVRDIRLWQCRQEGGRLAAARGWTDAARRDYADHLAHCALVLEKDPEYWHSHSTMLRIAEGEGPRLDFKEMLGVNPRRNQAEHPAAVLKAITAFLNAEGGTVLVGVEDGTGAVRGLARDYGVLGAGDPHERFEQRIRQAVAEFIRRPDAAADRIRVEFDALIDGEVCRIEVPAAPGVTLLRNREDGREEVFVRVGSESVKKSDAALLAWSRSRVLPGA